MNVNLLIIIKKIIIEYGDGILSDPQRLKAFFSDLAKDEPKPLRIAFGRCVEAGAYNALKTAPDAADRVERKAAIAQRLRDEQGLDVTICGEVLDILEAVLFTDMKAVPRCTSCGGELREEWKLCPFCGMAIGAKQTELSAVLPIPSVLPQSPAEEDQTLNDVSSVEQTDSGVPGISIIGYVIIGAFFGIVVGAVGVVADVFYDYAIFICGAVGCVIGGIIGSVIRSQRRKPYITPKSSNFSVDRIIIGGIIIGAFFGIVVGAVGVVADVFYDYAIFICGAVGCVIGGIIGSVIGRQRSNP